MRRQVNLGQRPNAPWYVGIVASIGQPRMASYRNYHPFQPGIPQMASPRCRRWQHKGRTSTNPALNRYGRSRSALCRADMAMGNPAQWSFHALRAHPGLGSAHLSSRATRMLLDRAPSWRQRRRPQPVNEAQDLSEQRSWDGDLRQLEGDIAPMAHDLSADLDELLP